MEDSTSEYKNLNYIPLPNGEIYAYRKCGNKDKIIILAHGNQSSAISFMALVSSLISEYTVYAPDLRGYGNSTYNKIVESHSDYAEDLKLFLDALKITKCSLLGWSAGGPSIFTFGINYPEYVEKLMLMCSVGPKGSAREEPTDPITKKEEICAKSKDHAKMKAVIETKNKDDARKGWIWLMGLTEQSIPENFKDAMDTLAEESLLQRNYEDIVWICMNFNVSNENKGLIQGDGSAAKLTKKLLIIAGEKDPFLEIAVQEEWKKIVGDNATLKVIPGMEHCPTIAQFAEVGGVILDFLKN
jgi:pimeloyl-ACP methyl ester carboxylesterase